MNQNPTLKEIVTATVSETFDLLLQKELKIIKLQKDINYYIDLETHRSNLLQRQENNFNSQFQVAFEYFKFLKPLILKNCSKEEIESIEAFNTEMMQKKSFIKFDTTV